MAEKRLGILLSTPPDHKNLQTVFALATEAVAQGVQTYLYLIDEGVRQIGRREMEELVQAGVHLLACAYSAQRRGIPPHSNQTVTFSGLIALADLVKGCDRFVPFN